MVPLSRLEIYASVQFDKTHIETTFWTSGFTDGIQNVQAHLFIRSFLCQSIRLFPTFLRIGMLFLSDFLYADEAGTQIIFSLKKMTLPLLNISRKGLSITKQFNNFICR